MRKKIYAREDNENYTENGGSHFKRAKKSNDFGGTPFVGDMEKYALNNNYFRSALWTGKYMQLTLMSIKQGEDVGIEMHENTEQLLIIAQGRGIVTMGNAKENMNFQKRFYDGYAIIIPAGIWHNIVNTGRTPLKIYSVYAPPHHPFGILHETKDDENVRL